MSLAPLPDQRLYQQLADNFAEAIHQGTLKPGKRLPAIRRVAQSHQVSVNTVLNAWQLLEDRGLIEARPQSGYYVRGVLPAVTRHDPHKARVRDPSSEKLDLIDKVFAAQNHPDYINISLACPQDSELFPAARIGRITAALLRRHPNMIGRYALPPGSERLREEIARRALHAGQTLTADEITLTHGCMEALQLALRAVTQPGDCVGLESPTYFFLFPLLASLGLKALEIPTDPQHGLSLDALEMLLQEQRIKALIAMPSAQNPLGYCMSLANKKRLAKLVNTYHVPLIEDGLYDELQFDWPLSPAVKAFDRDGWVLYCTSFTKTVAPDFRIGWIAAGRFHSAIARLKAVSSMAESALLSETLAEFLANGGYDHHLRTLRRRYAANLDQARGLIARHFPQGTRATLPRGGFVFWVELPGGVNTTEMFDRLLQEQICVTPGALYSLSERYNHALRLSCCYPFDDRYSWAIRRAGEIACELAGLPAGEDHGVPLRPQTV
ncbi:DNA-binding transcriptional MocR family regulator [Pantoea sp. AN62]|uniref:PLP-dependent aminotransferase family protein n=1 Tax=Pantoea brenneri TaxID=472694 RepID=A0ABU9MRI6_9GAMM|nr:MULTISPECIES: PLP-dependent aminotransferase family protein [Pantoea]KKD31261.1 GntR family transcriptional regulator [Pantoea sp. 3.5.1]MCQ5472285.1 PLP-dependent aminotransferase family protein [Pantoea brenneri]MDH1085579.1 PLP-dependent aminotransferase family protein [Pantoea brenneri]MDU4127604.1 PLP-dependent aminotransferase family protein [Pantoea sp.]MDU4747186.1 PLP-dependent aminotransferase family protein [Pantoea sp.]